MIITLIIFIISIIITNFYKTKRNLHMIQQNLYNENNRYIKWVIKNNKQFFGIDIILIAISSVGIFVIYDLEFISIVSILIISLFLILIGIQWRRDILNDQNKKKLVVTARIKRLIITTTLLYILPLLLLINNLHNYSIYWIIIFLLNFMTYINCFIVFLAMIINTPIEKCIFLYYKRKAQNKLKSMTNLKVVGITGSYGKTSSKNILGDILNIKYNAFPSPKNLNTLNGLMMTINNDLDKFSDVFIAEMGAYVRGEISQLCKLVKPKYGILTTIGTAHLESFGSEENIIKAKFELIESLPKDGFAVLNGDDPKQVNYKLKNKVRTIWIGIDNKDTDVVATNIKCSSTGTSFDVKLKNDEKLYHFETRLLGNHNVYNILAAIACGLQFNIEMEDLVQAVKSVRAVEHRLELKRVGNFYMIDDAYNSNPVGAKGAVNVLKMMPGIKVVVTPGMIELGDKEYEYNKIFGEQIAEVADYAILIGKKQTRPIKEGLILKGFNKDKIIIFNDVRDAYTYIGELAINNEVYALFENDLPDTYNEK